MGLGSFLKKIFGADSFDEAELREYREKHGIDVSEDEPDGVEIKSEMQEMENYDVWEDIRNVRMNFFFGSWVTRKFRPIGEDKLKKDLEELERKRREKAEREKAEER